MSDIGELKKAAKVFQDRTHLGAPPNCGSAVQHPQPPHVDVKIHLNRDEPEKSTKRTLTTEETLFLWCRDRGLRPCKVDGELCAFHALGQRNECYLKINIFLRPEEKEQILKDFHACYYAPPGCDIVVSKDVFALVEFPDGRIKETDPERVHFLDGKVRA